MLKAVQYSQLIDKDVPQREALGGHLAFGGNLPMPIKDAFEMFVKIFDGPRTQLVKDTPHLDALVGMGAASIVGGDQQAVGLLADLAQIRGVVMAIAQHETHLGGDFSQQGRRRLTAGDIGRSEQSSKGNHTSATTETTCSFQP